MAELSRGELDRQRKTVQATAECGSQAPISTDQGEARSSGAGALNQQTNCVGLENLGNGITEGWNPQPRHREEDLARNSKCLSAGCQDAKSGRRFEKLGAQLDTALDKVLTVIENEQGAAMPEPVRQLSHQARTPAFMDVKCRSDLSSNRGTRNQRPEIDELDSVGVRRRRNSSQLERQPCLPATPNATQRQQSRGREELPSPGQLVPAPDEFRERRWKHRRPRRGKGGVVSMNGPTQLGERITGIDPELVVKESTGGSKDREGIGASATAMQSQHELPGEALPTR